MSVASKQRVRVARRRLKSVRQRQRAQQTRGALYDPSVPLAGKALRRAAHQVTDAQFKPKLAALSQQAATERTQGNALIHRTNDYYRGIAQGEAQRVATQKALGDELDARLSAIAGNAGAQIDRAQQDQQAAQAQDAALRGPGLAGGGDQRAADELAAQRARAAQDAAAYRTAGAAGTANYGGLVNATAGATALHGAEARKELVNRLATRMADIRAERKSTKSQKGDVFTKTLLDLRQSGFENAATTAGLGIKREQISAQAKKDAAAEKLAEKRLASAERHNRALERNARRGQDITARGQTLSHADRVLAEQGRNRRDKNKTPSKKNEPQSSINTRAAIVTVQGEYEQLLRHFKGDHALTAAALRRRAAKAKKPLPEYILVAAADLTNFGYVTPGHVRALRQAGVRVPAAWLHPRHRPDTSSSNSRHGN